MTRDETDIFRVGPRSDGKGFILTGPPLAWPLWYRRAEDAVSYARHRGGEHGGIVETVDAEGTLLASEPIEKRFGS